MSSPGGFGLKNNNGLMAVNVGDEVRIKENLRKISTAKIY